MAGAVNNGDDLNRVLFPCVAHDVRVEVPEAIAAVEKFFVIVADAGRPAQVLEALVNLKPEALRGSGAILGNVEKDR